VFVIGIDPHKGSHTAAVIDRDEEPVGELSVQADRRQRDRLLAWAARFRAAPSTAHSRGRKDKTDAHDARFRRDRHVAFIP
jgi:hypothetical protein